jgi:glycosyltransferase involved in cell wall biosynthesis
LEIVAWEIAVATAQRGMSVDFFACGPWPDSNAVPGLTIHRATFVDPLDKRFGVPMPLWSPRSMLALAAAVRKADIVHTHDTLYFSSVLSAALARWYRRPLVVTVHVSELRFRHRFIRQIYRGATYLVSRRLLKAATRVTFVGATAEAFYSARVAFRQPPVTIQNGVDRDSFRRLQHGERQRQRALLRLPLDRPVFLFVGRFVEKKGLPLLFKAVQELPNVTWVFVGEGPLDPARWELPNVVTPGRLERARVAAFYQVADLVVSPGLGEGGVTLVVQEAMSCGSPVLVSNEVAGAFGAELPPGVWSVDVSDVGASVELYEVLGRLAAQPALLQSVRDDVARFSLRWSWRTAADSYESLYRALLPAACSRP